MPRGRPTKYSKKMLELALDYLENYNSKYGSAIPTIEKLARVLKVHKDTVYEWQNQHKEFSDVVHDLRLDQHEALANGGLRKEFDVSMVRLFLCKHGYSSKAVVQHEMRDPLKELLQQVADKKEVWGINEYSNTKYFKNDG